LSTTVSVPGPRSGGGGWRATAAVLGPVFLTMIVAVALLAILASSAQGKEVHLFESQIKGSCPAPGNCEAAEVIPFSEPFALATDGSDDLWVSDAGASKVLKFDPAGAFEAQNDGTGSWEGSALIRGIAFSDASSHLYVAQTASEHVWVLNSDATFLTAPPGAGDIEGPWGEGNVRIAADNSAGEAGGDLYLSSSALGTVTRIDGSGDPAPFSGAGPFVSGDQLTGPFVEPKSIAVDPATGDLYVASGVTFAAGAVYKFAPSGELIGEFTGAGISTLGEISALAVDPTTGNLLISELQPNSSSSSIVELSPTGAFEGRITEADGTPLGEVKGIATDSAGRLYAADATNHVVDVFGPLVALPVEVEGQSVTEVASTSATLQATIAPNGIHTSYYFEYGTAPCSSGPGACTKVPVPSTDLGSPEVPVNVAQHITGLQPGVKYFYRVVAIDDETAAQVAVTDLSFFTQTSGPFARLDGRQWELVSPPDKHGARVEVIPAEGVVEAASDGRAISYLANAATEADSQGSSSGVSPGVQVLSTRGEGGWSSHDLATPHDAATGFLVGTGPEYRFFAEDLSSALVQPFGHFNPPLSPFATEQTPYLRLLGSCGGSCYLPLVTGAPGHENVPPGTHFGEERPCEEESGLNGGKVQTTCGPLFLAATSDLSHVVLSSVAPLVEGAPAGEFSIGGIPLGSLYEWSAGHLELVSVLPEGTPAPPAETRLGTQFRVSPTAPPSARRALSANGARIFWESQGSLYVRDMASHQTLQLDAAEPACLQAGECESGGGHFQIASSSGSQVFFTDERRLTADAGTAGEPDLYECEVEMRGGSLACGAVGPVDLTPETGGESADIQGDLLGASEDGSTFYFVAQGTLGTGPNLSGESARAGQPNLYVHRDGRTSLIATLASGDNYDWRNEPSRQPVRVSPDGQWLSFMSERPLTGYDNHDRSSGQPDAEIYLYDASAGRLSCASCDPVGALPIGEEYAQAGGLRSEWGGGWVAALPPITTEFTQQLSAYQARYLSNTGRLFFNSLDALVPQDTNGNWDVYEYEPPQGPGQPASNSCTTAAPTYNPSSAGCVDLISSGTAKGQSAFLDASESGDDVFFITGAKLAPQDVDNANDVYDAHVCSAAVPCPPAPEPPQPACSGDACQQPATPPVDPTPGSLSFSGAGNVVQCPKGKVKKQGKCVKKKSHKAKKHKKKPHKQSKGKTHGRTAGKAPGGNK
jgi:WD40-like Beta Propeller Repeat